MTSWEYKIFSIRKSFWGGKDKDDPEILLNELGRDGWELTSVVPLWETAGSISGIQFFLKRKRF